VLLVWLVLGGALLVVEVRHLAFYALFGALGCFGAAITAAVAPSAVPAQIAVAVVLAVLGVVTLRPYVSRVFDRRDGGPVARGVHGGLVGHEALTLDPVSDDTGHVRLLGERWLAVSGSGTTIPPDTKVLVTAVRGTTLTVWPVDGSTPLPELGPTDTDTAPGGAEGTAP